ncbi:MAG TPA: hypothetical protein VEZ90_00220 [Blastocatellia bacterium]|nr:hypothetical protein [Blastocatellia bacterium]
MTVEKIKHPDAGNLNGNVSCLEAAGRGELCIELSSSVGNAAQERAARAYAMGGGDFADHCQTSAVLNDEVIVFV